ncbi:MutS family DNA mismatch repair protein [Fodinibius sp. Rm-B-1B1-1]|uniref:MutS family DNA mismatch repair protein n=1 Tax=Fodinibius alkaliphilus TaxID=3140241 RepID=UPI003159A02C
MNTYSRQSLQNALQNQVRRLQHKIKSLDQLSGRLSMGRLAGFIGGLALVYTAGQWGPEWLFWVTLLLFIVGFSQLARFHKKVEQHQEEFEIWKAIRQKHIARQTLDWPQIPERSPSKNYEKHPFANDLDIIGKHSLLQLMDTSTYQGSTDKLTEYLLERKPNPQKTKDRQAIIKELTNLPQFRDRLHLLAELNGKQELDNDWDLDQLLAYLHKSEVVNYILPLAVLGTLAGVNIVLLVLYLMGMMAPYVIITFVAYLVIYNFNSEKISGLYTEAHQIEKQLSKFNGVLHFLETYNYDSKEKLKAFCSPFWSSDYSPSKYVKGIIRIAGAASSQQSEIVWVLLNFLVPWDLYFAQKLSRYKKELAPKLDEWLTHFYQLEAFSSMANFGWLHPEYQFSIPDKKSDNPFTAKRLGHPLIPHDEKVTNDISIDEKGDILLITGSNMAGKSTFLRTMGINLSLCFAGAPVNASSFQIIPFRIYSSINVTDSLDDGLSHFYAEVKRLRGLLELLNDNHETPVFFLVDEIYRGTNNRERLQGSEAFLKNVAGKNGVGLVSTHDLELAQLEESIPELSNWHFAETIEGNKMRFEYKLKPGPCPSTNALKIMEMEGLPT